MKECLDQMLVFHALNLLFYCFFFFDLRNTEISFHCLFFFPETMFVFSDVAMYFNIAFILTFHFLPRISLKRKKLLLSRPLSKEIKDLNILKRHRSS